MGLGGIESKPVANKQTKHRHVRIACPPCHPFWANCLIKEKTEVVYVNSCRTPSNQLLGTAVRHSC